MEQDAIEFYTRKLARTEAAVQEWREKSEFNKVENYGFASLAAVPYAHIVANRLNGKHPKGTTITLAPNPKDIVSNHRGVLCYPLMYFPDLEESYHD